MSAPQFSPREGYSGSPGVVERNFGTLNGVTNVTVVAAPGEGRIRQVIAVTVPNTTAAVLIVNLYLNNGTGTTTLIDTRAVGSEIPIGDTYTSSARLPVILLRDFDSLEMDVTAAATPSFYAVWAEWNASVGGGIG